MKPRLSSVGRLFYPRPKVPVLCSFVPLLPCSLAPSFSGSLGPLFSGSLLLKHQQPLDEAHQRVLAVGGVVHDALAGDLELEVGHVGGEHLVLIGHVLGAHSSATHGISSARAEPNVPAPAAPILPAPILHAPILDAPILRAGDLLVVEEDTPVVEARLAATALGPAARGATLEARLSIGGKVVRVRAIAPGRATLEPGLTPEPGAAR